MPARARAIPDKSETGSALSRAGVVSGLDMTVEAALAKLFFLLGSETSPEAVRQGMEEDLCGELSHIAPRAIKTIIEKR
jgi:L-asparaginase